MSGGEGHWHCDEVCGAGIIGLGQYKAQLSVIVVMNRSLRHSQILDISEKLVRKRGFNGFSYADIASELGITKATIHHHFATKSELGMALIERFQQDVFDDLDDINLHGNDAVAKLSKYAEIYKGSFLKNQMCLGGILAAEHETLSLEMQEAIITFFEANEAWIENVLKEGILSGDLEFEGSPADQAKLFVANLQGALMLAKATGSTNRIDAVSKNLVNFFQLNPVQYA